MLRSKVAALAVGATLSVGVWAVPAAATTRSTETTTPVPGGGATTITLAGIGTITLNVDATTGAVSNVVLTPTNGVTGGAPVVTPEGVQILVTLADGTQQSVQISGEMNGSVPAVETEVQPVAGEGSDSEGDGPRTSTPPHTEPEGSGSETHSTPPSSVPESHTTSPSSGPVRPDGPSTGRPGGSD